MAQLTRLGLGGYSTANRWPLGTGAPVDFAGSFVVEDALTANLSGSIAFAGALITEGNVTANLSVAVISYVDFAGAFVVEDVLTANVNVAVAFAGAFVVEDALAADVTVVSVSFVDFAGALTAEADFTADIGVPAPVDFAGDFAVTASLAVADLTQAGWQSAEFCPPSLWTPLPPCDSGTTPASEPSLYGRGGYGVGPYSRGGGTGASVYGAGAYGRGLYSRGSGGGSSGWTPVRCGTSVWEKVEPCNG